MKWYWKVLIGIGIATVVLFAMGFIWGKVKSTPTGPQTQTTSNGIIPLSPGTYPGAVPPTGTAYYSTAMQGTIKTFTWYDANKKILSTTSYNTTTALT